MSRLVRRIVLPLVVVAPACGDEDAEPPLAPAAGIAVVNSDYVTTSVSLLDPRSGAVTNGNCIDSGTRTAQNTLALSGDVVLPSQPQPGNTLVTIDRTNGALTWLDPTTCTPLRQLDVSTGFFANPHDVVAVSATKAYVTRYEVNATPTADPSDHDDGDDLLVIDPSTPAITGRIPMAGHVVAVAGATLQARPDRARLIDGKLFVALQSLSGDFMTAGHGRLVVIDTATDVVTGTIDLPGLENCGGLSYVAETETLVVACGGAFGDPDRAAGSGLAYVDVAASPPALVRTEPATPFGGRALAGYSGIAHDGAHGYAVTFGELSGEPKDQLWSYDVAAKTATKVLDARESFTLGTVLVDPGRDRVYVSDASAAMPRVHVYRHDAATLVLDTSVEVNPGVGLPPRELGWY